MYTPGVDNPPPASITGSEAGRDPTSEMTRSDGKGQSRGPLKPARGPGSGDEWCTTLQQPATVGVFAWLVSIVRKRRNPD